MAIDYATNLPGRVNVVDFSVVIGTVSMSADFQKITIPFTGSANPAKTSSVNIVTYQYSLDDGTTWSNMTLDIGSSDTANLTFDVDGEDYELVWNVKTDLGTQVYNNSIKIKIQAQATFGTDSITATRMKYIYFPRVVTDEAATSESPFPLDYSGVPGNDLLKYAPRQAS